MESVLGSASNVLDCESTHAGSLSISGQSGSAVSGGGTTLPLINAIAKLEKRIALLDGPTLDALKAKATVLKSELEAAANAKTSRSTTASEIKVIEAVRKVDDLYEKINRVQAVATDLPALVLRLKTLETVHQTSANFTQRLAELESIARGAAEDIKNNSEVLGNLKQVSSMQVSLCVLILSMASLIM